MRFLVLAAALFATAITTAKAETFPLIDDSLVLKECGDCHMAYPPQTLTKAVWHKMMINLNDHFGEDASMDESTAMHIQAYLELNASDVSASRAARKWTSKTKFSRITEGPRFIDKHGACSPDVWKHAKIKSKANCLACHKDMLKDGSTDADISFLPSDLQASCNEMGAFGVFIDGLFD